jgi:hypothetical protein
MFGNLTWRTPLAGLQLGGSDAKTNGASSTITDGAYAGTLGSAAFNAVQAYGRYEKSRLMVAGE